MIGFDYERLSKHRIQDLRGETAGIVAARQGGSAQQRQADRSSAAQRRRAHRRRGEPAQLAAAAERTVPGEPAAHVRALNSECIESEPGGAGATRRLTAPSHTSRVRGREP